MRKITNDAASRTGEDSSPSDGAVFQKKKREAYYGRKRILESREYALSDSGGDGQLSERRRTSEYHHCRLDGNGLQRSGNGLYFRAYSYDIIKDSGEFVINLTTEKLARAADTCGVRSGRDIDKFKEMNLTAIPSKYVSAPSIAESPVNIECRVKQIIPLGSHDMFIAEVLGVTADRDYMDESGHFDLSASVPLVYSHGGYYRQGRKIGKFGFSVEKKRKKKKKHLRKA